MKLMTRGRMAASLLVLSAALSFGPAISHADAPAMVETQPFVAHVERLLEALQFMGRPLTREEMYRLAVARELMAGPQAVEAIQAVLDPHCLALININPEARVSVDRGPAPAELTQGEWRAFLVRVTNQSGVTAPLRAGSRHAFSVFDRRANIMPEPDENADRWMGLSVYDRKPLEAALTGLEVEYRIIEIYSRDAGKREGQMSFHVGEGTQDLGFRNDLSVLFKCAPAVKVTLRVLDDDGEPTMASFIFRDASNRVYPYPNKRLEPDFFFHDQVYRADGESVTLAPGRYTATIGRGPEYLVQTREIEIPDVAEHSVEVNLERWVDPNELGWYSGDHHIHAAGCLHYRSPTIGVTAESMMRHVVGEGLNIGCVLTWGPGWYTQKANFTGEVHPVSTKDHIIRYDIEISGFPSDHCGHLVLLRLKEDDYPGAEEKTEWPSWTLPILKWAKSQGGVVGFAHSGNGLSVYPVKSLPNYVVPPMNGIGAQEYLVDLTFDAVDFISAGDTPAIWELNMWYHSLNCGFRAKISGETDFPCIYGDKVGMGRGYVKLDAPDNVTFDHWVEGIKAGRSYVSDGLSHLMEFGAKAGAASAKIGDELALDEPCTITVTAKVAAMMEPEPMEYAPRQVGQRDPSRACTGRPMTRLASEIPYVMQDQVPVWHLERARIERTRLVPVEVIVNGYPVARREIEADGSLQDLEFEIPIERSSWVAIRILYSSHTNPIFVMVGDEPIRASKRSAIWALKTIDQLWKKKRPRIRESERLEAARAFEKARNDYRLILEQSFDDR